MMVLHVNYDDRLVSEGFSTPLLAAAFLLRVTPPGWTGAVGDNYDDVPETLMALATVGQQMRFLVGIYPRAQVIATVAHEFPDVPEAELNVEYASALAAHAAVEQKLNEAVRDEEAQAAVLAEHDLSQTMHEEDDDGDRP